MKMPKTTQVKYAGIEVVDTQLIRDAVEFARSIHEPFLYNHVMRSWLFAVVLGEKMKAAPDPELVAAAALLHDLGLTEKYAAEARFEVDGANAARSFLHARGVLPRTRSNSFGTRLLCTPMGR
jgi:HD superfamily phosphodiesterase